MCGRGEEGLGTERGFSQRKRGRERRVAIIEEAGGGMCFVKGGDRGRKRKKGKVGGRRQGGSENSLNRLKN